MIRPSVVSGRELDGFSLARGKKRRLGPPELMQRFFRWKSVTPGYTVATTYVNTYDVDIIGGV